MAQGFNVLRAGTQERHAAKLRREVEKHTAVDYPIVIIAT